MKKMRGFLSKMLEKKVTETFTLKDIDKELNVKTSRDYEQI